MRKIKFLFFLNRYFLKNIQIIHVYLQLRLNVKYLRKKFGEKIEFFRTILTYYQVIFIKESRVNKGEKKKRFVIFKIKKKIVPSFCPPAETLFSDLSSPPLCGTKPFAELSVLRLLLRSVLLSAIPPLALSVSAPNWRLVCFRLHLFSLVSFLRFATCKNRGLIFGFWVIICMDDG